MIEVPNFILEAKDFFSSEECQRFIEYYERMDALGFCESRQVSSGQPTHVASDSQFYIAEEGCVRVPTVLTHEFLERFWRVAYPPYRDTYSIIGTSPPHKIFTLKIQKTLPGQGYHVWHHEQGSRDLFHRMFFFIMYLNTVEEGGETEFLYYKKRIKAETGKLLFAPAGFMHTHRGNPPLTGPKYIVTGWVEYE